ncbi:MAG TPA: hypothetical protein VLB04_05995, partial [Methanotrichaceae archaeon]|nr:hypothetical protein [Methanotrichaceae archaeon]
MAIVFGLLLVISASAQPGPLDLSSLGSIPDEGGFNQAPRLISLTSDRISPQEAGATIVWTARALDTDNDVVYYMFRLKGPATDGQWKRMTEWTENSNWSWVTSSSDIGENQISVWVRDGKHEGPDAFDDENIKDYTISAPEEVPVQGIVPVEQPLIPQPPEIQLPGQQAQEPVTIPGREQAVPAETFTQVNEPPEIRGLMPSPASPQLAGTAIVWTADAFDQENDQILYRFFLNDQPVTSWQPQNQWTWTTTEANAGENQIEVRIIDGQHAVPENFDDSRTAQFTINAPNQKPAITGFNADRPSPQEAGAAIVWTVEAADPEDDQILYQFWLNGRIVREWSPDSRWTWTTSEESVGENQVEARIVDTKHATADGFDDSRAASFTIAAPNQKPAIVNFAADRNSPQEAGTAITWTAEATDPEGDQILYRFFLNGQPATDWQPQNQWVWATTQGSVGESQVQVAIRDGKHAGPEEFDDSRSAAFTISAPNQIPTIITLGADSLSPQEAGAAITWTVEADDTEDDQILYRFFLNGQPATEWQPQNQWVWTTTQGNVGDNQIQVAIRDGRHAGPEGFDDSETAGFTITAPNQKPTIVNFSPDKPSPQEAGAAIIWTADAADQENDQILYQFSLNGQPVTQWQPQNQWTWTTTEANAGDNQVEVRIIDSRHAVPENFDDSRTAQFT